MSWKKTDYFFKNFNLVCSKTFFRLYINKSLKATCISKCESGVKGGVNFIFEQILSTIFLLCLIFTIVRPKEDPPLKLEKFHKLHIKKLFNLIKSKKDTTLSIEYWNLKQKQEAPKLTWEIKGQYKAYNPTLEKCNLCLNEKLAIIDNPDKKLTEQ